MTKKIFSVMVAALTLSAATAAYAGLASSGPVSILEVDAEADPTGTAAGAVYLKFASAPFSTSCSLDSFGYWILGGNADSIKAMQAVALAAKLAGKQVKVNFNNTYSGTTACSQGGTTGYPVLRAVNML